MNKPTQLYDVILGLSNTIVRIPIKNKYFIETKGPHCFFSWIKVRLWRQLVKLDDPEVRTLSSVRGSRGALKRQQKGNGSKWFPDKMVDTKKISRYSFLHHIIYIYF